MFAGRLNHLVIGLLLMAFLPGCPPLRLTHKKTAPHVETDPLSTIADTYVKLVLATGRHDGNYVDAYYGPPEWKKSSESGEPVPVAQLIKKARTLLDSLKKIESSPRRDYLEKQLIAVETFLQKLSGKKFSLDEEARLFYDMVPPRHDKAFFEDARKKIEKLLPGEADLPVRVKQFRDKFTIPPDKMDAVVKLIMADTRKRTAAQCNLPDGEQFRYELVTNKPWGGYNWYQGNLQSLIQLNTDLPTGLAHQLKRMAHEGYPGHHTYNVLLEDRLVRGKGWREYTVYPLYSPQSLIAEGTANAGIDIIYPGEELLTFLKATLSPVAGLDIRDFEEYLRISKALRPFRYASAEAARLLLDEGKSDDEVVDFLVRYGLYDPERARKSLDFIRMYRSYVFNYTAGEDLVRAWLGDGDDAARRFFDLLERPATPSELLPAKKPEPVSKPAGGKVSFGPLHAKVETNTKRLDNIDRVFLSRQEDILACYRKGWSAETHPDEIPWGKLFFTVQLSAGGEASVSKMTGSTLASPVVEQCVLEQVKEWDFSSAAGTKSVTFDRMLFFSPPPVDEPDSMPRFGNIPELMQPILAGVVEGEQNYFPSLTRKTEDKLRTPGGAFRAVTAFYPEQSPRIDCWTEADGFFVFSIGSRDSPACAYLEVFFVKVGGSEFRYFSPRT